MSTAPNATRLAFLCRRICGERRIREQLPDELGLASELHVLADLIGCGFVEPLLFRHFLADLAPVLLRRSQKIEVMSRQANPSTEVSTL